MCLLICSLGGNIGVNANANHVICNDKEKAVIDLLKAWKHTSGIEARDKIIEVSRLHSLTRTDKEAYLKFRTYYNSGNKEWYNFYSLIAHSFNNQIRFNRKGEFNVAFGLNRSDFNPTLQKRLVEFVDKVNSMDIEFLSEDFRNISFDDLTQDDLVYCDPPYLISCANYNENGGWTEQDEYDLLKLLDALNAKGVKFALSNVLEDKGKSNDILKEWAKEYNVHYLNHSYSNCNYQRKDKSKGSTIEVLITNY